MRTCSFPWPRPFPVPALPGQPPPSCSCVGRPQRTMDGGQVWALVTVWGSLHGCPSHQRLPLILVPAWPVLPLRGEEPSRRALFRSSPGAQPCPRFHADLTVPWTSAVPAAAPGWQRQSHPPAPVCWQKGPEQLLGTPQWRPAGAACVGWLCLAAAASSQGRDWGCLPPTWAVTRGKLGMVAVACCVAHKKCLSGTRPSARSAEGL